MYQAPEKIKFVDGIFANERERLTVLGMLVENLGIDKVIQFGKIGRLEGCGRRLGEEAGLLEPALIEELI